MVTSPISLQKSYALEHNHSGTAIQTYQQINTEWCGEYLLSAFQEMGLSDSFQRLIIAY